MSSGVILLNKDGVAFGADSAITFGQRLSIFKSYNKILKFGNKPIAGILYSNLSFMGVPFDLIFKEACINVYDKITPKNKLIDYINDLFKYFEENEAILKLIDHQKKYLRYMIDEQINEFFEYFKEIKTNWSDVFSTKAYDVAFQKIVDSYGLDYNKILNPFDWNKLKKQSPFTELIKKAYTDYQTDIFERDFELKPIDEIDTYIMQLIDDLFGKYSDSVWLNSKANGYVGFAIAGYGNSDIFPSLIHLHIHGFIDGKTQYTIEREDHITHDNTRAIETVAQAIAIDSFIDGITPKFRNNILSSIFEKVNGMIKDKITNESEKNEILVYFKDTLMVQIEKEFSRISRMNWDPILESIRILPIHEMCRLAEGLVNIQSLRSKYESDDKTNATVGGPTYTASITKSEGFKWFESAVFSLTKNVEDER